jgi:POT family proton-dependent oligopeptide transporter
LSFYCCLHNGNHHFWGAFEQAGGLMNLYTDAKTDRMLLVGKSYGYVSEFKRRIYYTFATGVAGFGQNVN